jgi:hypothetical protein
MNNKRKKNKMGRTESVMSQDTSRWKTTKKGKGIFTTETKLMVTCGGREGTCGDGMGPGWIKSSTS